MQPTGASARRGHVPRAPTPRVARWRSP